MSDLSAKKRLLEVDDENDMSGFPRFLDFYRWHEEERQKAEKDNDGEIIQHDIYIIPLKNLKLSSDFLGEREDEGSSSSVP